MPADTDIDSNANLIRDHFEAFVNRKDLAAIDRNLAPDFIDHDGPAGQTTRDADRAMMARMHELFPDLHVDIRDTVAQGDKVAVRNLWTGTHVQTGQRMECHGFVLWRIAGGKIAERWATVTPMQEATAKSLGW